MHIGDHDELFYRVQYFSYTSKFKHMCLLKKKRFKKVSISPKSYTLAVVMLNMKSTLDSPRQLTCIGHDELFNYELITGSIWHPCDPSEPPASGLMARDCILHLSTEQRGDNSMGLYTRYSLKSQSPACMDQST